MRKIKVRKKILVYHPRMFGDIIIGSVAAKELKQKYKGCVITYITSCKSLTETNPFIDRSIEVKLPKRFETLFFNFVKLFYDKAYFMLHWLPDENIIQSHMNSCDLPRQNYPLRLYLEEKDEVVAENYLKKFDFSKRHTIAIQEDFGRKWNEEKFEKLKELLSRNYNLVFIGQGMRVDKVSLNFREAAAVISKCDLYVGGISGTMHAAVAVDTPTIATPNVFPAEWDMPEFTQNEFIKDPLKKHVTVFPKKENFCGQFAHVHNNGKYIYVDGDNYSPQVCFEEINMGMLGAIYEPDKLSIVTQCRCSINPEDIYILVETFFEKLNES